MRVVLDSNATKQFICAQNVSCGFFLNIMIFKWLSSKYDFPCLSTPPIDERSNGRTYASLTSEKPISVKK